MSEQDYVLLYIADGRLGDAPGDTARRGLTKAFAIAAQIVENAGAKLMNARRRATSEG